MDAGDAYIGQIVNWQSSLTNEGQLLGYISGLALNCSGELIAEVTVAVYTPPNGEGDDGVTTSESLGDRTKRLIHFSNLDAGIQPRRHIDDSW